MNKGLFKDEITQIEDLFWEVNGLSKGEYDAQAINYDRFVSNKLYNKIMWGNTPRDYTDFCKKALRDSSDGVIADIGCGTLSFTYKAYTQYNKRDLFLCDLSYEMLKLGKKRIINAQSNTSSITFLRADALDMPFLDNSIRNIFSFGIFHIFKNRAKLIQEIVRILQPHGQLFLTSLCSDRKLSAKYLNFLYKKKLVAKPLDSRAIKKLIQDNGIKITQFKVKGGMTYISGKK